MNKAQKTRFFQSEKFYFLLEALFFIYLFGYLFSPRYFLEGLDMVNQYLPYKDFLFSNIQEGFFPAWNPYIFAGRPFYADSQAGIFYPFNYLLAYDLAWGFSIITLLHFVLAFAGMYFFLRSLKLSFPAVHFGAFIFTFSSFFVSHLLPGIMLFILAGAWTGWILWSLQGIFNSKKIRYRCLLSVFIYLTLQAGAPQIALYSITSGGLYLLFLSWQGKDLRTFIDAALFFIFGILLSVISLFPVFHFASLSFERAQGITWEYAIDCSWTPRYFILSIFPFFYAFPAEKAIYWGGTEGYWEVSAYWGIPALVLFAGALLAFKTYGKHKPLFGFAFFLFCLSMLLALGKYSPLFYFVYRFVPVFSNFRVPGRYIFPATIGLSIMISLYADGILKNTIRKPGRKFFTGCAVAAGIGLYLIYIYPLLVTIFFPGTEIPEDIARLLFQIGRADILLRVLLFIFSCGILALIRFPARRYLILPMLFFLLIIDLGHFGKRMVPVETASKLEDSYYQTSEEIEFLKQNITSGRILATDDVYAWYLREHLPEFYPNRLMMHGLRDARGYDPLNLRYYVEFINILGGFEPDYFPGAFLRVPVIARPDLLPLLNIEFILSTHPLSLDNYSLARHSRNLFIYESDRQKDYYLRFYSNWKIFSDKDMVQQTFLEKQEPDYHQSVAIVEDSDSTFQPKQVSSDERAFSVDFHRKNDSHIRGTIEAPNDGILVLSESFHPSWVLHLNDKYIPSVRTNYAFNGFYIPQGTHDFTIVFLPGDQYLAMGFFFFFLFLFILTITWKFYRASKLSSSQK